MAQNIKAIKTRIKSIENTKKITKAMELVSSSKLKSAIENAVSSKPYFEILKNCAFNILRFNNLQSKNICHIVIAGDRGLAGGYNSNVFKMADFDKDDFILPIGKKAIDFFKNRNTNVLSNDYSSVENISIDDCNNIAKLITSCYFEKKLGKVKIYYTEFKNALIQIPKSYDIIPTDNKDKRLIIYEVSYDAVFNKLMAMYISGGVFYASRMSYASELASRVNAMQSASKNAKEMIDNLNLSYNRARQGAITQEISEIIAGKQN